MPFIGNKPSAVPLTSADIADSIITSAKIVDGTIVNADINASAAIVSTKLSGVANTPAFYAFKNTNQSIANDTDTLVSFQTEILDTNNCFNNSSTYRFTPTVAGKYYIFANLAFGGASANDIRDVALRFNINGTLVNYNGGWSNYANSSASTINVYHSILETFNGSTDYISVYGRMVASTRVISGGYPDANARNVFFGGYKIIE